MEPAQLFGTYIKLKKKRKKADYMESESMTTERAIDYEPQSKITSRSLN